MSDHIQTDTFDRPILALPERYPPLPWWLAERLLRNGETVTWVRGPRFNPPWERHVTHPALFLPALALGVALLAAGCLTVGPGSEWFVLPALLAGGVVFGSIFTLGLFSGYFTRLVVTNQRVVILQGYEVCRVWGLDRLPRSLVRYRVEADGQKIRSVDVEAVKTLFGNSTGQFTDAKTILEFGKRLTQITTRQDGQP
jgi:hypothetical protein